MEAEIAELESFIDSYVGDEVTEPISSEVFTNTKIKTGDIETNTLIDTTQSLNGYEYNFKDNFQEELLEHQEKQASLRNDSSDDFPPIDTWVPNGISVPIGPDENGSHFLLPAGFKQDGCDIMAQYYPLYPHEDEMFYQQQGPVSPTAQRPGWPNPTSPNSKHYQVKNDQKRIPDNDLRHRLNNNKGMVMGNGKTGRRHSSKSSNSNKQEKEIWDKDTGALSWRRPSNTSDSDKRSMDGQSDTSHSDTAWEKRQNKRTPPKNDTKRKSNSRHSSHSSNSASENTSPPGKVVSGRSKAEVRSWIKQEQSVNPTQIEKQMRKLVFSPTKDLPKLIKSAQSFITNDKKMREVAEMVCSKALKNPLSAENGAILCNEMSKRITNGTSFRSIILNIVQEHYKNREGMIATAIKNPKDSTWFGFMTFLTELYLKLRTTSNERLRALVNPVFDCLFLMLHQKSANCDITKCFCDNVTKVGSVLQEANPHRMSELISLLRDNCILPNDLSPEARRYLLQSLESYARGWKSNALDNKIYYQNCSGSSKILAS